VRRSELALGLFKVESRNKNALKMRAAQMGGGAVKVGVLASSGSEMVTIALSNEFGATIKSLKAWRWLMANMSKVGLKPKKRSGKKEIIIPERSFIRSTFDNRQVLESVNKIGQRIFLQAGIRQALSAVGLKLESAVRNTMNGDIQPDNHPFTVIKKGAGKNTLNATGRLQQQISSEVIK